MTLNPRAPTPHGFVAYAHCARCGTERPETALAASMRTTEAWLDYADGKEAKPVDEWHCLDVAWCGRQVGFKGELTGVET